MIFSKKRLSGARARVSTWPMRRVIFEARSLNSRLCCRQVNSLADKETGLPAICQPRWPGGRRITTPWHTRHYGKFVWPPGHRWGGRGGTGRVDTKTRGRGDAEKPTVV